MIIFPLSWPGKIVLILIALALGIIFWMLSKPEWWKEKLRKRRDGKKEEQVH